MRQKHSYKYFAYNQSYLAEGKIASVELLPKALLQLFCLQPIIFG